MTAPGLWQAPGSRLELTSDQVHVWRATLEHGESRVEALRRTLSAQELKRAERFYFERDRRHFIVARGVLRAILARYQGGVAAEIRFWYGTYGKPALEMPNGGPTIQFNLSHSNGLALYGFSCGHRLGIDVEYVRAGMADQEIAERFFSPREIAALRALPSEQRQRAFFMCWTRKEAYAKARGRGLAFPLDEFDMSLAPAEPARLLRADSDPGVATHWSLQDLIPSEGYVAAIAVEAHDYKLMCFEWAG